MPETIRSIEARYSSTARRPITLAGLAANWGTFARDIEAGYRGTIDDFTNDMTERDMLERAMQRLDDHDRVWLTGLVAPGDVRYRDATVDDPDDRLAAYTRHEDYWWWFRLPRVSGDLPHDLGQSENLARRPGDIEQR